jgi:transposase
VANTSAKYTDEYRRKTADYIISTGRPTTEVCRELGLNLKTANRWVKDRKAMLSGDRSTSEVDAEMRALQKRNAELEMENAFLKKPRPSLPKAKRRDGLPADAVGEGRIFDQPDGAHLGGEPVGLLYMAFQGLSGR